MIELQVNHQTNVINFDKLQNAITVYLKENKFVAKNTNIYLNLDENNAYFVEKKEDDILKNESASFDELYAILSKSLEEKANKKPKFTKSAKKEVKEKAVEVKDKVEAAKEVVEKEVKKSVTSVKESAKDLGKATKEVVKKAEKPAKEKVASLKSNTATIKQTVAKAKK